MSNIISNYRINLSASLASTASPVPLAGGNARAYTIVAFSRSRKNLTAGRAMRIVRS